ncbi:PoNe immunity protein domain-containing protein [Streptococcus oriscaviae]|uniref:DUF1911 domain-containing protein n=1 Tax=Streptococcus oriscaviae TaxID=2781599 RepID=A0ABX7YKI0_9STRE|nr:PoNe immunity protein domain-containing protein [Streptococcus oriscaviae]QUE54173.1 DUF1911 domain-containing protein [Streptococcus oriscaviae]
MFRDKYKDSEYFEKRLKFNMKTFDEFEGLREEVPEERLDYFYLSQSGYSKKLLTISYSLGLSSDEIFKWFKISLHYYSLIYSENDGIFTIIDYLSLAVLFDQRKEEFIDDIRVLFDNYQKFSEEDEIVQDDYIDALFEYLLEDKIIKFHSNLEYLNMIGYDAGSVIEAQKFWYYAHSDAAWYDTHKTNDAYYGYWSFDTAALCKIRGIYDERLKALDYFPYDLLVQTAD